MSPGCSVWMEVTHSMQRGILCAMSSVLKFCIITPLFVSLICSLCGSPTRRTVSLQSVGNLWASTASDIARPTDLDGVGLCFETEISRCALDFFIAQDSSDYLQIAGTFQNGESL